jgi:hypothetical protein
MHGPFKTSNIVEVIPLPVAQVLERIQLWQRNAGMLAIKLHLHLRKLAKVFAQIMSSVKDGFSPSSPPVF